jgi:hypothetical protein
MVTKKQILIIKLNINEEKYFLLDNVYGYLDENMSVEGCYWKD